MKTHISVSSFFTAVALLSGVMEIQAQDGLNDSIPASWLYMSDLETTSMPCDDTWWRAFDDSLLDSLIRMGFENNYSLDMVARRINIARSSVGAARSSYFPEVTLGVGWTRSRSSGMTGREPGAAATGSYWNLGLDMSWEIDLFGKITSRVGQEKSLYKATKAEYAGAMLVLASNIASTYFQLRVWQTEREIADRHTERQLRVVKITEDRFDCGLGNMLEVTQAREVYYSTMSSIPVLENSILVGVYPEEIYGRLSVARPLPGSYILVPVGLPADLLSRRPDIVQARMQLASYAGQLGIARKDFLPALTINGSVGTAVHDMKDMFDRSSVTYSISPTLSWTLFSGLKRRYNAAIAREQLQIGLDNYNLTVMTAVRDVENAMSSYRASLRHIEAMELLLEQSAKALDLALDLYKSSLTQFSNVVNAQMNVLANENSLVVARGRALSDIVTLHEAIGGGWSGVL